MIRFAVPYLIYSIAALVCIFLQSELFSCIEIFNAKPDLLLLLVVLSGLKSDWKNGIAVGLLLGFWLDLFNGGYFGMNMVVYGLIGGLSGVMAKRFPDRTYEGYFFTMVGMTLCSGFLSLMIFNLLGARMPIGQSIAGIIFPMTFYTALISFLCLPLVWIYRHINRRKIGRIDLLGNGVIFVRGNEKVDMEAVIARRQKHERERAQKLKEKNNAKRRKAEYSASRKTAASRGNRDRRTTPHRRNEQQRFAERNRKTTRRQEAPRGYTADRRQSAQNRSDRNRNRSAKYGNRKTGRRK